MLIDHESSQVSDKKKKPSAQGAASTIRSAGENAQKQREAGWNILDSTSPTSLDTIMSHPLALNLPRTDSLLSFPQHQSNSKSSPTPKTSCNHRIIQTTSIQTPLEAASFISGLEVKSGTSSEPSTWKQNL